MDANGAVNKRQNGILCDGRGGLGGACFAAQSAFYWGGLLTGEHFIGCVRRRRFLLNLATRYVQSKF